MKVRYRADTVEAGDYKQPVVKDRRARADGVIAFCNTKYVARIIAAALNARAQRRLDDLFEAPALGGRDS